MLFVNLLVCADREFDGFSRGGFSSDVEQFSPGDWVNFVFWKPAGFLVPIIMQKIWYLWYEKLTQSLHNKITLSIFIVLEPLHKHTKFGMILDGRF